MTTAAPEKPKKHNRRAADDPELYRMSLGDHLEELRWRLILGLLGFVVVFAVCLYFGNTVASWFCRPLLSALKDHGLPPWTVDRELGGSFMVYIRVSLVTAAAISAPWMVYQIWLFVAAGLYTHERKWVTRYAPLSITLLISGMVFVYFVVLPMTIRFFIEWTANMPIPSYSANVTTQPTERPARLPVFAGDPDIKTLQNGDYYYNSIDGKLNIVVDGALRSIPFAPMSLVVPNYELGDYIDMVVMMLLMFGLAFQLPLVVAAVIRIGIVEPQQLKSKRRYVYFGLLILAAAITPGDVITATIALMVPMILLYEMGIFLGERGLKRAAAAEAASGD